MLPDTRLVNVERVGPAKSPASGCGAENLTRQKLTASSAAQLAAKARGLETKVEEEPGPLATETPVVSTKKQRQRERNKQIEERTRELLALFRGRWPCAFTKPRPLVVGVNGQIVEAFAGQATPQEIGRALKYWTTLTPYLGRLGNGHPRIALDGSPGEPATAEQRRDANARLMARLRRKAQR
jgi:hypothetical protein